MTSNNPCEIIGDDNDDVGFDWEAAVREIDVACQNTNASTSSLNDISNLPKNPCIPNDSKGKKKPNSRQSKLDGFVAKKENVIQTPQLENVDILEGEMGCFDGDERASFVDIDTEAAKTWIYPVNVPLREYQLAITKSAIFSNTLVALPTGLGKTLIAAVVMYNYFRWFPKGKIVFAAPSRPLVMQQIEACHNIVGIPQEWTIDMTGQISPSKRACYWKEKRVFFVTPQVLEKDIQSGSCLVKYLVCLVIDEAHRAMGNYSYCVAVRELMAVPVQLRILALTATPGSKQQTIQHVINNLQISTLEYRNETDPDVIPYIHNRKIELIQVAMGQDAQEIDNKILEVIRPIVSKLSAIGVLQHRDYLNWSPCELLTMRDKFRQAPPPDLSHVKYNEVEGNLGVLISLYYIHKILSSHGIRPAYEMLEEKLQQGFFARFMSKNENILKAKSLMQQSLSHGARSPKLSKMLEVLHDHFKTNHPQNTRAIIFSNYRESVRDIMDALANGGDSIRAAQFIGQSSGKALKGQSQKVQQAVLENFRRGGYNVIVATSIGEEGLDIMEVDLVICFDANISPLRMTQRMGRTGRKHDGRVIVLACEGSELKGYMRKQATSKTVHKHMRNGGINSFSFHSSPRMIPHVIKPEVQFVGLSIQQFVRHGNKEKAHSLQTPLLSEKLTVAESNLITKYFHLAGEDTWKPSLIAFPHFQSFPSRVHNVMHSQRTVLLIETMQRLQGPSFSGENEFSLFEDKEERVEDVNLEHEIGKKAVDAGGKVLIAPVPSLPSSKELYIKHTSENDIESQTGSEKDPCCFGNKREDCLELGMQDKIVEGASCSQAHCVKKENIPLPELCNLLEQQDKESASEEEITETPSPKRIIRRLGDWADEVPDLEETSSPLLPVCLYNDNENDEDLSPRLTKLIESGVVPESPTCNTGQCSSKHNMALCYIRKAIFFSKISSNFSIYRQKLNFPAQSRNTFPDSDLTPPVQMHAEQQVKSSSPEKSEKVNFDCGTYQNKISISPVSDEIHTPVLKMRKNVNIGRFIITSQAVEEGLSFFAHPTSHTISEDSQLHSEQKSESVKSVHKFKRLRKVGDIRISGQYCTTSSRRNKHGKGKRKPAHDVRVFIDEEAELSSDADVSDDEIDDESHCSYDSFIDDRINLTTTSLCETSGVDMMAIYRRSLLSQSPITREPKSSVSCSPYNAAIMARISESGNSSYKTHSCTQTPYAESKDQSGCGSLETDQTSQTSPKSVPHTVFSKVSMIDEKTSKRKLNTVYQSGLVPAINLEPEFALQSDEVQMHDNGISDILYDDNFYDGLDLDALEAQATLLLKQKSNLATQKQEATHPQAQPHNNINLFTAPSFDLGI